MMRCLRIALVITLVSGASIFPTQAQQVEDRSYTLIKETFHIHYPDNPRSGPQPDGDTLKFLPETRQLIENLPRNGRPPKFTQTGITTIRFEGIDTLETHFSSGGTTFHQHMALALASRDTLLAEMGFGQVMFHDGRFTVESVEHHPIPGYILSNGLDVHGRTIAFVFTGTPPNVDGSRLVVAPGMLDTSLNAVLLKTGQAYPAFYLTLPVPLREHLKKMVKKARNDVTGLWADATATTTKPATISDVSQFQNPVIWPKLFRRLGTFFSDGQTDLGNLDAWLREDPRDRDDRLLLPTMELGNMHNLLIVQGDQVSLAHPPEDVVIVPDDFVLPPLRPDDHPTRPRVGTGTIRIVAALIDPIGEERGHETVTFLNVGPTTIDLGNWVIADNTGKQPLDFELASGETRRVTMSNNI